MTKDEYVRRAKTLAQGLKEMREYTHGDYEIEEAIDTIGGKLLLQALEVEDE